MDPYNQHQLNSSYSALPIGGSADSGSDDSAVEELQALCASLQKGDRSMARMADSILRKFDSMYMKSPQALHAYAVESLALLRTMESRLDATKHEWLQETVTFSLQSDQLKAKIAATELPTGSLALQRLPKSSAMSISEYLKMPPQETTPAKQPYDGFQSMMQLEKSRMQLETREHMAGMHVIGTTLKVAGELIVDGAKAVCRLTGNRENCKATLEATKDVGKKLLEVLHLKEATKEALSYLSSCDGSSLVDALTFYGIPKDQAQDLAQQYVADMGIIGVSSLPLGSVGRVAIKGMRAVFSTLRRPALRAYRITDSMSTYSHVDAQGRTTVVKGKYKTFYEPPQAAHTPFSGRTLHSRAASQPSSPPLLLGSKHSIPAVNQSLKLLDRPSRPVKHLNSKTVGRAQRSIKWVSVPLSALQAAFHRSVDKGSVVMARFIQAVNSQSALFFSSRHSAGAVVHTTERTFTLLRFFADEAGSVKIPKFLREFTKLFKKQPVEAQHTPRWMRSLSAAERNSTALSSAGIETAEAWTARMRKIEAKLAKQKKTFERRHNLLNEQIRFEQLKEQKLHFMPPLDFPAKPLVFKSDYTSHSFKIGRTDAVVYLKELQDSILFIHRNSFNSEYLVKTNVGTSILSKIRMLKSLEAALSFAEAKNIPTLILAWDPKKHLFVTLLEEHAIPIKSVGSLFTVFSARGSPLALVEIPVSQARAALKATPSTSNKSIELLSDEPDGSAVTTTQPPPLSEKKVSQIPPPFKEDLSLAMSTTHTATAAIRRDTGIRPDHIDIDEIFFGGKIREYVGSGNLSPVEEFIQTVIHQPYKVVTKELGSGNIIHTVIDALHGTPLACLKEFIQLESPVSGFIPEIVSQMILRAENLQNSLTPPILRIGIYTTEHHVKKGLVMYGYIHGHTLDELHKHGLPIPAEKIGNAFGEIGAVDSRLTVPDWYVKDKITDLSITSASVLYNLKKLGIPSLLTAERVQMFSDDMNRNRGRAGLVHGDVSYNNFIVDKAITVIDTGTLMKSVNGIGMAHGMPAFDQQEIVVALRTLGAQYGHTPEAIEKNVSDFLTGYRTFMPTISEPAENFARLHYAVNTLFHIARGDRDRALVESTMEWVNRDFGQTPVRSIKEVPQPVKGVAPLLPIERLNRVLSAPAYFPPAFELEISTLQRLHDTWALNQETLLGIIATEEIPSFGLHGATYLGMRNILNKESALSKDGDHLWVAGISGKKQPLEQLGALYAIAEAASNYMGIDGGLFIIDTSTFKATEMGIFERLETLSLDNQQEAGILRQVEGQSHADELHVKFTPENYAEKVKGLILDEDTLYSEKMITSLKESTDRAEWGVLAHRLKIQETLFTVFEKLGVIKDFHSAPWQEYQHAGKDILTPIDSARS